MSANSAYLRRTTYSTLAIVGILFCTQSVRAQCACGSSAIGGSYGSMAFGMPDEMMIGMPGDMMGTPGQVIEGDSIYLTIDVPDKAILQINGDPTISIGPKRYFVIRNLEPDETYKFVIVAETANAAGVAMEETQTLKLKPGARESVSLKPIKRKGAKPKPDADEEDSADESDSDEDDAAASDDGQDKTARRPRQLSLGH